MLLYLKKIYIKMIHVFYKVFYCFFYENSLKKFSKVHIGSINDTINELLNSNKSLSRFGDGEIEWIFEENYGSFEKNSVKLSNDLLKVLNNNNNKLMIGLPDVFTGNDDFTKNSSKYYKIFLSEYGNKFVKKLDMNKKYYNTGISRMYIDYRNKSQFPKRISAIKNIWKDKNVLMIEGRGTRFGVGNGLLSDANHVYRIECPEINAFESYDSILSYVLYYLHNNSTTKYLILISLGPSATILSYSLCLRGYRSIDIGHLDLEYEWYLKGAMHKINIPNRYVNEIKNGQNFSKIRNQRYKQEIIHII